MNNRPACCCLKVDVDTHEGMRDGVPRLLEVFKRFKVRASFFLSFGPDNSGKAIWNVFRRKGFLRKMLRTGAPMLYGWRTILSGTLLPARMIAAKFPDLVRRIEAEGHEVAVHAWDHRLWQDHLDRLNRCQIADQFQTAFDAFERILGRRPSAVGAPGWYATPLSLQVQDDMGLRYASDMRGGRPCFPDMDGYRSTTLQIPTTQPCLEEFLSQGECDLALCAVRAVRPSPGTNTVVIPLHAEVEGGIYQPFLLTLLAHIRDLGWQVRTLEEDAERILTSPESIPVVRVALRQIPGRSSRVLAPVVRET